MSMSVSISPLPTSDGHVQEVIRAAQEEMTKLLHERAEMMKRMGTLKQILACLAKMYGDNQLTPELLHFIGRVPARKQSGFTRACRAVLMESSSPMDARQGSFEMRRRFPELVDHLKNPLASVTTVFSRLASYGEARSFLDARGRRVWEWIAEPGAAEASLMSLTGEGQDLPISSIREQ